jgi:hypothetical protein
VPGEKETLFFIVKVLLKVNVRLINDEFRKKAQIFFHTKATPVYKRNKITDVPLSSSNKCKQLKVEAQSLTLVFFSSKRGK